MGRLDNKIAIITGGAGGIGRAAARRFLDEGARVLLVDLCPEDLEAAATELDGGNNLAICAADVTQANETEHYVAEAIRTFGRIDIMLANAGLEGVVAPIEDYPEDVYDQVMAVNVKGVWLGLKYAMPAMAASGGGSIVITSSVAGIKGSPTMSPYITSKHAVIGLMRSAAMHGTSNNIRVNTVNPAPVETRMMRSIEQGMGANDTDAAHERFAASVPMGRYADPSEIANVMLFLASDEASFVTGGVYMADGGTSAR